MFWLEAASDRRLRGARHCMFFTLSRGVRFGGDQSDFNLIRYFRQIDLISCGSFSPPTIHEGEEAEKHEEACLSLDGESKCVASTAFHFYPLNEQSPLFSFSTLLRSVAGGRWRKNTLLENGRSFVDKIDAIWKAPLAPVFAFRLSALRFIKLLSLMLGKILR